MATAPNTIETTDAASSDPLETPTFIVGAVRSGTTLLRLMLDHHPEVAFHFEFEFAVDKLSRDGAPPPMEQYREFLRQDRVFLLSGSQIDESLEYGALVRSFLDQHRKRCEKRLIGATVHHNFDRLPAVWPEAKYVHLVRDGRDVARSCIEMGWYGNMYHGVERWVDAERCWAVLRDQIPEDRWVEVRYEDLILDPRETLDRILRLMGTEFDDAIWKYAESSTYGMPDERLIAQWKRKLNERQVQLAEARIAEMLVERGYELSDFPRLTIDNAAERRLAREDWAGRFNFRRKRYGLPTVAADFLSRRLGVRPMAKMLKRRMDSIDNQHLK